MVTFVGVWTKSPPWKCGSQVLIYGETLVPKGNNLQSTLRSLFTRGHACLHVVLFTCWLEVSPTGSRAHLRPQRPCVRRCPCNQSSERPQAWPRPPYTHKRKNWPRAGKAHATHGRWDTCIFTNLVKLFHVFFHLELSFTRPFKLKLLRRRFVSTSCYILNSNMEAVTLSS